MGYVCLTENADALGGGIMSKLHQTRTMCSSILYQPSIRGWGYQPLQFSLMQDGGRSQNTEKYFDVILEHSLLVCCQICLEASKQRFTVNLYTPTN